MAKKFEGVLTNQKDINLSRMNLCGRYADPLRNCMLQVYLVAVKQYGGPGGMAFRGFAPAFKRRYHMYGVGSGR